MLQHLEFAGSEVPSRDIAGRTCRQVQGKRDEDIRTQPDMTSIRAVR